MAEGYVDVIPKRLVVEVVVNQPQGKYDVQSHGNERSETGLQ
ncbi:MAG TPA: hypothetical protein VI816_04785 [Candidatus Bathyarchaeia archaeon]|nr:hypothetical protein [Candidatus Bathyarchaeia archaeon]